MKRLIILRGLPYSGKTTWAINKPEKEGQKFYIYDIQQEMCRLALLGVADRSEQRDAAISRIVKLLLAQDNIIIDDNNLLSVHMSRIFKAIRIFYDMTGTYVNVTIKEFHTPLWLCLKRAKEHNESEQVIEFISRLYRHCLRHKIIYSDEENSKTDIQVH